MAGDRDFVPTKDITSHPCVRVGDDELIPCELKGGGDVLKDQMLDGARRFAGIGEHIDVELKANDHSQCRIRQWLCRF